MDVFTIEVQSLCGDVVFPLKVTRDTPIDYIKYAIGYLLVETKNPALPKSEFMKWLKCYPGVTLEWWFEPADAITIVRTVGDKIIRYDTTEFTNCAKCVEEIIPETRWFFLVEQIKHIEFDFDNTNVLLLTRQRADGHNNRKAKMIYFYESIFCLLKDKPLSIIVPHMLERTYEIELSEIKDLVNICLR